MKFSDYLQLKENKLDGFLDQPHIINSDPPMTLPDGIKRIAEAFKKSKEIPLGKEVSPKGGEKSVTMKNKKLFIAGSAVKNHLLGRTIKNYEIVTDAHPDEVVKICRHAKPPIQITSKDNKSGVVKVNINGENYKIETLKSTKDEEGKHEYTTELKRDAERRDLTVNALYYDVLAHKIIDFVGGLRHLKDGIVKFVGGAENKLKENPLDALSYTKEINILPNAKGEESETIHKHLSNLPENKARESFWESLEDLHSNPQQVINHYKQIGLLDKIFPGLNLNSDLPNCKTCKSRPIVMASLLKHNKPREILEKLTKLGFTKKDIKDTLFLVNLLHFSPDKTDKFKYQMLLTSLSKRQILDWAKSNNLNMEAISNLTDSKYV